VATSPRPRPSLPSSRPPARWARTSASCGPPGGIRLRSGTSPRRGGLHRTPPGPTEVRVGTLGGRTSGGATSHKTPCITIRRRGGWWTAGGRAGRLARRVLRTVGDPHQRFDRRLRLMRAGVRGALRVGDRPRDARGAPGRGPHAARNQRRARRRGTAARADRHASRARHVAAFRSGIVAFRYPRDRADAGCEQPANFHPKATCSFTRRWGSTSGRKAGGGRRRSRWRWRRCCTSGQAADYAWRTASASRSISGWGDDGRRICRALAAVQQMPGLVVELVENPHAVMDAPRMKQRRYAGSWPCRTSSCTWRCTRPTAWAESRRPGELSFCIEKKKRTGRAGPRGGAAAAAAGGGGRYHRAGTQAGPFSRSCWTA